MGLLIAWLWPAGLEIPADMAVRLAAVAIGLPVSLLIHEGGHWAAGTAMGQRCLRFLVWPVEFVREGGRWRFRYARLGRAALVNLVPRTFAGFRLQRAVILAAGPLASLAGILILTALLHRSTTPTVFWCLRATILWLVVGVVNLLPFQMGNLQSDGFKLQEALRGGEAFDRTQYDLLALASHATALRPRDWPEDAIVRLADSKGERHACYLAYVHFLDRGDQERAGRYLYRLLEGWSATDPPEYALEAAFFLGWHERDAATARKWLDLATGDVEPWVRLRADGAVALAEGKSLEARDRMEKALDPLRAATACGAHEYEAVLLRTVTAGVLGAVAGRPVQSDEAGNQE